MGAKEVAYYCARLFVILIIALKNPDEQYARRDE